MSSRRCELTRLVLATSLSCLLSACVGKEASPVIETSDAITDVRAVTFKGRVCYRDNGRVLPLSGVTFTRRESPEQAPKLLDISADDDGRFESELVLEKPVAGHRRRKRGTIVVIDSPGCSSMELQVNDDWRPKTLELACEFR